ncbi:hypothetical protein ASG43_17740 [Aureimonas sp. Leaf454]|uniref:hypothetical protein n=1 Tax=Aureimonas sp. Leaf454 TaxID=1736381 RepID=UPI0006F4FB11|nr:hypothetical protein [Aureimonas sp. Leaf454]KQT53679.1 hypothetical protein ASG43_17740 [Aureimonas sp. Leaf454]
MGQRKPLPSYLQADELRKLAERVARLTISRRDPHRFFEDRSEIAHDLRRLAEEARYGRR